MSISSTLPFFNLTLLSLYFLCRTNHLVVLAIDQDNGTPSNAINSTDSPLPSTGVSGSTPFRPGITAIMGVLAIVVSIAILLLVYVQYCNSNFVTYNNNSSRANPLKRENSGVEKKVIQLLPLFRFASLRGQKDGLECAVCLTRFDSEEVLRLLPKCKHAFHVECVDTWLNTKSTCPLCRYKVDSKDVLLVDHHESYKTLYNFKDTNVDHSGRHSSCHDKGKALEIIVETPEQDTLDRSSSSGSRSGDVGSGSRSGLGKGKEIMSQDVGSKSLDSWKTSRKDVQVDGNMHRLEHRIILSGSADDEEESQRRWSDVGGVEFLYLRTEMIMGDDGVEGSGRGIANGRSVSEMTGKRWYKNNNVEERGSKEDGIGKRWFAWISRSQREKRDTTPPPQSLATSSSL